MNAGRIRPFWAAVLGYRDHACELLDPAGVGRPEGLSGLRRGSGAPVSGAVDRLGDVEEVFEVFGDAELVCPLLQVSGIEVVGGRDLDAVSPLDL